ncbi:MAG TPA: tetratricopeptide repeat protein [Xanthomonadales bacterium]
MSLFNELKRRNVFRVAIGYVISTWLLAQVADLVLGTIGAPAWVMQTILLVIALGFPVVLFFSWAYEVTPEGIKRESDIDHDHSITPITARKLDRAIMAVLVVALAYFVWESRFAANAPVIESKTGQADATSASPDAGNKESTFADNSIAVLPFVNMSSDQEQEYFSDGLSEELLNLLAKNPALRVAARTSSFSFKEQNLEITDIAQRLKVAYVLEGSVRKANNQLRITAQLIQTADGYHLWSETYDRNLDNIFAIQEEIASKITAALLPRIVANDSTPVAPVQTGYIFTPPADIYQEYLLARNRFNQQTNSGREDALNIMTELVRAYPDYADAQAFYALLSFESSARTNGDIPWVIAEAQSREAMEKALTLNPENAEAYVVMGLLHDRSRDTPEAIPAYEKAIELNPSYSEAYVLLADAAMRSGQQDRAWAALDMARSLDPVSPVMLSTVAHIATIYDRPEMAEEAMKVLTQIAPEAASRLQIHLYTDLSETAKAVIQIEQHRERFQDSSISDDLLALYYAKLGLNDLARGLSSRVEMLHSAMEGNRERVLELAEQRAASKTDPHDRADEYWGAYYFLGMYDEALTTLSDLWYGYAEQQMGARMDVWDCTIFAQLLMRDGRIEEARPVIEKLRREGQNSLHWWIRNSLEGQLLAMQGDMDGAMRILQSLADQGHFIEEYGSPYADWLGLKDHPDYPALLAKFETWQNGQRELYESLKSD